MKETDSILNNLLTKLDEIGTDINALMEYYRDDADPLVTYGTSKIKTYYSFCGFLSAAGIHAADLHCDIVNLIDCSTDLAKNS